MGKILYIRPDPVKNFFWKSVKIRKKNRKIIFVSILWSAIGRGRVNGGCTIWQWKSRGSRLAIGNPIGRLLSRFLRDTSQIRRTISKDFWQFSFHFFKRHLKLKKNWKNWKKKIFYAKYKKNRIHFFTLFQYMVWIIVICLTKIWIFENKILIFVNNLNFRKKFEFL